MPDADDIARRAREIGARAEHLAEDATDSEALREELNRLDAELAQLDEEQRRLEDELRERGDGSAEFEGGSHRPAWTDALVDLVSDVTERIGALGAGGWPWRLSETVDRSVAVDTVTPVVIENRAGSIKVRPGDAGVVRVSAELFAPSAHLLEEMAVSAELEGSQVLIRCQWPDHRRGRRARLIVGVPSDTPVRAITSSGSISIKDTHGPAAGKTRGGSITMTGTNGEADARTAGGTIRVDDHIGAVHASTNGWSVHLSGVLTGDVEATTAGGSIDIDGASHATVIASTSGGSIRVGGRLAGHSRIRTAGGSVTISIPSDSQLRVDGKGSSSACDFPGLDAQRGRIYGTLGDGSEGTVEFRTSGGSVRLAKS
jgi:hypothetical protein